MDFAHFRLLHTPTSIQTTITVLTRKNHSRPNGAIMNLHNHQQMRETRSLSVPNALIRWHQSEADGEIQRRQRLQQQVRVSETRWGIGRETERQRVRVIGGNKRRWQHLTLVRLDTVHRLGVAARQLCREDGVEWREIHFQPVVSLL